MSDAKMRHPYEEDLHAYLDRELAADQVRALESHLDTCPVCTGKLVSLRTLFGQIESLSDTALDVDLSPGVLHSIAGQPRSDANWWRVLTLQLAVFSAIAFWLSGTLRARLEGVLALVQSWIGQTGFQPDLLELLQGIQLTLAQLQPQVPGVLDLSIPRLVPTQPELGWAVIALGAGLLWLLANRWLLTGTSMNASRSRRGT
jgi:hypothetical protein